MANLFDADQAREGEPDQLVVGDFVQWKRSDLVTDYPLASYSVEYVARITAGGSDENMIERGELVYIDHIIKRFEKQLIKCKTKLLAAPTKIAAEVHAAADVKEAKSIMEAAIEEALSELVGYDQDDEQEEAGSQADGNAAQDDGPPAKADGK